MKWIIHPNLKTNKKILEENIGKNLCVFEVHKELLGRQKNYELLKKKINWPIKLKSFCSSNDTLRKMKRQAMEWKKIFAMHIF